MITGDQVELALQWWAMEDGADDWWCGPVPPHQFRRPSWTSEYESTHGPVTVETVAAWPVDRGACSCGWHGPVRHDEMAAWVDVLNHLDPQWDQTPTVGRGPRDQPKAVRAKDRRPPPVWPEVAGVPFARVHICGPDARKDRDPALGVCRGAVPGPVLEVCAHSAHWDQAAVRQFRWAANGERARLREQHGRKVRYANAPLAEAVRTDGRSRGDGGPLDHCAPQGDGNHLFCRWEDCPCPCHCPTLLPARHEARERWGDHCLTGHVRPYGPDLPPPLPLPRVEPERQLALF